MRLCAYVLASEKSVCLLKDIFRRFLLLSTLAYSNRWSSVKVLLLYVWILPICNVRCLRELRQATYIGVQVVCTVQKSAWMDKATFLYWANTACQSFCLSKQPPCLIMDSCAVHESSSIKEALRMPLYIYIYISVLTIL